MRRDQIRISLNKNALTDIVGKEFMLELSDSIRTEVRKLATEELGKWQEQFIESISKQLLDINNPSFFSNRRFKIANTIDELQKKISENLINRLESKLLNQGELKAVHEAIRKSSKWIKDYWEDEKSKIIQHIDKDIQNHIDAMVKKSLERILR